MTLTARRVFAQAVFALAVFATLFAAMRLDGPKNLRDFDQSFYLTIAYDLVVHGVYSNGVLGATDVPRSSRESPAPGMFLGPAYPVLLAAMMRISPVFGSTVRCAVEANRRERDPATCPTDVVPMHVVHALLLTLGVLAISAAAGIVWPGRRLFLLAGGIATLGVAGEASLFSFLMTESLQFGLYGVFALALVRTLAEGRMRDAAATGGLLGLLILTKPSWIILAPVCLATALLYRWLAPDPRSPRSKALAVFVLALAAVVGPWVARNAVVLGKSGLTEEYGAASLIERFAFNRMTLREGAAALPYCLPVIGPRFVGPTRFEWDRPGSFFDLGRGRRDALVAEHRRLDPIIGEVVRAEMVDGGWLRHLGVALPLAWCGLFVGQAWSLVALPLFLAALVMAVRRRRWLFVAYAMPTFAMVALHALVANHYPRYNLALIGPMSIGAAVVLTARDRPRRT